MAEVLQRIKVPLLVSPSAPAGLQNAPGCTPVRTELVVGLVVRGALVVRFGAGLGLVRVGFGVGFGVGRTVGAGLLVVAAGVGDSAERVAAGEEESDGSSSRCCAEAEAVAELAADFLSSEPPMADRPPPQQQRRSTPRTAPPIF
ncbi:hypothetical protein ACFFMM_05965 [Micromonospora chaiyaphumensis]|uniref:hypothetical protein n=1 Tax=Micromonospora chaiyaphumensis TaxID=307119 RepID=UPI000B848E27|nr:hypothetical protein [Micromonospora chaiyaphumensis]